MTNQELRLAAQQRGDATYTVPFDCKRKHTSKERYTSGGNCVECSKEMTYARDCRKKAIAKQRKPHGKYLEFVSWIRGIPKPPLEEFLKEYCSLTPYQKRRLTVERRRKRIPLE